MFPPSSSPTLLWLTVSDFLSWYTLSFTVGEEINTFYNKTQQKNHLELCEKL